MIDNQMNTFVLELFKDHPSNNDDVDNDNDDNDLSLERSHQRQQFGNFGGRQSYSAEHMKTLLESNQQAMAERKTIKQNSESIKHVHRPFKRRFTKGVLVLLAGGLLGPLCFCVPFDSPYNHYGKDKSYIIMDVFNQYFIGVGAIMWMVHSSGFLFPAFITTMGIFKMALCFLTSNLIELVAATVFDISPLPIKIVTVGFPACIVTFVAFFVVILPRNHEHQRDIYIGFFRSCALLALAFFFCATLVGARIVFKSINGSEQTYFSIVFFLLKIGLKSSVKLLTFHGSNPDFEPVVAFWFDLMSGIFTNLLFLDLVNNITFVMMMSMDVSENLFHLLKADQLFKTSHKISTELVGRSKKVRIVPLVETERRNEMKTKRSEIPAVVKELDLDVGEDTIELRLALNYLLCLGMSEVSEVVASVISSAIVTVFVFGPNKDINSILDVCSTDNSNSNSNSNNNNEDVVRRAFMYSLLDATIELALFMVLSYIAYRKFGFNIFAMLTVLFDKERHYFFFGCFVASSIPCWVFSHHGGVDESFLFEWVHNKTYAGPVCEID